jgi:hypothetical protein
MKIGKSFIFFTPTLASFIGFPKFLVLRYMKNGKPINDAEVGV